MQLKEANWHRAAIRLLIASMLAGSAGFTFADSKYATEWGPSIGATAPLLSAKDQDGQPQNLASLKGSNGLLFVFNRSVDW